MQGKLLFLFLATPLAAGVLSLCLGRKIKGPFTLIATAATLICAFSCLEKKGP